MANKIELIVALENIGRVWLPFLEGNDQDY